MDFENDFILGIDLGNKTTTVSYYKFSQKTLELIDISGGYGKASVPTVVSYNNLSKEFIFGEYAILNRDIDDDIVVDNMVKKLGNDIYYNINEKSVSLTYVLSRFILYLIDNIKNINPNAIIKGIVVSVSNVSDSGIDDIKKAFNLANIGHLLLNIANDNICIIKEYMYKNNTIDNNILILDYANTELRASLYTIDKNMVCVKSSVSKDLSEDKIFKELKQLITYKFLEETDKQYLDEYEKNNINIFTHQQFDTILQRKNIEDIKIYYNFYYPPFQKVITKEEILDMIEEFRKGITQFFINFFKDITIQKEHIKNIALCGGGLEISFIQNIIQSEFNIEKINKRHFKRAISDGALIQALEILEVLPKNDIHIEDINKIKNDIGIFIKNGENNEFFPLAKKGSYIWECEKNIFSLVNGENELNFSLFIKCNGEIFKPIKEIKINVDNNEYFTYRNKKTIRMLVYLTFKDKNNATLTIEDYGFGEIYKKTDFKEVININID